MQKPNLREYQKEQSWEAFNSLKDHDAVIYQSPTGSGKGFVMGYIFYQALQAHKHIMFMVYGRAVVDTFCQELADHNIPHTKMMAGHDYCKESKAVVASISTLQSWYFKQGAKYNKEHLYIPEYILVDECRKLVSPKCREVFEYFISKGTKILGFDATPKAKGLSQIYSYMSHGKSTPWHIDEGNLVPVVHYAPAIKDTKYIEGLKEIRMSMGDYSEKDMERKLSNSQVLIGDLVTNYEKISMDEFGEYRRFVVACMSRNHAKSVQSAFEQRGHKVAYVDGTTKEAERRQIFADIETKNITGIISVLVMIYGVNVKPLEIAILARPTKDVNLLLQFGGRVLRPSPETEKEKAVFIDHTKALQDIGYIDDEYSWDLDAEDGYVNETKKKKSEEKQKEHVDITCSNCSHVYSNASACPKCGEPAVIKYDAPNVVYYNTELIRKEKEREQQEIVSADRQKFVAELKKHLDNEMGGDYYKKLTKFNQVCSIKYGMNYTPKKYDEIVSSNTVSQATKNYIKYVNIRTQYRRR